MLWMHNTRLLIEIGRERKKTKTRLYIGNASIAQPTVNMEDSRRRRKKTNITTEHVIVLQLVFFALCKSISQDKRNNRSLEAIAIKKNRASGVKKVKIIFLFSSR